LIQLPVQQHPCSISFHTLQTSGKPVKSRKRDIPAERTKSPAGEKTALHPRNPHRDRYDFAVWTAISSELAAFVSPNAYGEDSIDFANPAAVKALNRALLLKYYGVTEWDIPSQYLCPPIPGRADYLHYAADLLAETNAGVIPRGDAVHVLDIGCGANCIYPLLGRHDYGWQFVGTDIDAAAIANAQRIVEANTLGAAIILRLQPSARAIFQGVVQPGELFDLAICNPPFHVSQAEAQAGTRRKWKNLGRESRMRNQPLLNFGGQGAELFCEGGEAKFVCNMIAESARLGQRVLWFTSLIAKAENLPAVNRALKQAGVAESRTLEMSQGQKKSRIVAWTFQDEGQRQAWCKARYTQPA
jgi:23S rRNA (adenine1618-N6)-methyltransferase